MDTSESTRTIVLFLLVWLGITVGVMNCRLLLRVIFRKKNSTLGKTIWPGLGLLMVLCATDAFYIEPDFVVTTHHAIKTSKLPPGARVRIVQLSDLHVEGFGKREKRMLVHTAKAKPDLIVLTGDYRNEDTPETVKALERIAKQLSAIAPTYAIHGNWDGDEDIQILSRGGVIPLEKWTIVRGSRGGKVALGQVEWLAQEVTDVPTANMKQMYKVLLNHVPRSRLVASAEEKGVDLMLAGHTHGGQVRLPLFGALLPDRDLVGKYQAGLNKYGESLLYVNRGIGMEGGNAPRVRFFCRPEVAVIDIITRIIPDEMHKHH